MLHGSKQVNVPDKCSEESIFDLGSLKWCSRTRG